MILLGVLKAHIHNLRSTRSSTRFLHGCMDKDVQFRWFLQVGTRIVPLFAAVQYGY